MNIEWLGQQSYGDMLQRQRRRRDEILAGTNTEVIWFLEHNPPVITVGRRPAPTTPSPQWLAGQGMEYFQTERGGLATWHGPGQLVGYVLVDIHRRKLRVRDVVTGLEGAVIDWLAGQGVCATRRPKMPGVWVEHNKICAVGLHFRKGVSMHGLALNLCPDLQTGFGCIVPCGITDGGVTSLAHLTGRHLLPEQAWVDLGAVLKEKLVDGSGAVL